LSVLVTCTVDTLDGAGPSTDAQQPGITPHRQHPSGPSVQSPVRLNQLHHCKAQLAGAPTGNCHSTDTQIGLIRLVRTGSTVRCVAVFNRTP
jgi:hypothetical protein